MITKQISTYDKKIERAKEIIAIREKRVKNNNELIKLIYKFIKENSKLDDLYIQIKSLELSNKKMDCMESNVENEIAIRVQNEILSEDLNAYEKLIAEKNLLLNEIEQGKWDEYVEQIKVTAMNIRRKNPKADTSRLTNAVSRSYESMNDDEKIDHFKLLKQLSTIKP